MLSATDIQAYPQQNIVAEDICFSLPLTPTFDSDHSLPGRIRGALWAALLEVSPDWRESKRAQIWQLAHPAPLLFSDPIKSPPRCTALPHAPSRPYLLATAVEENRLSITLRLFGPARVWSNLLRRAVLHALTVPGIAVAPLARSRKRFSIDDITVEVRSFTSKELPPDIPRFRIVLESPLRLARRDAYSMTTSTFISSAVSRMNGILAWSGETLEMRETAFFEARSKLEIQDIAMRPYYWDSYSTRIGKRKIFGGMLGAFTVSGVTDDFRPILALVPTVGLGMHTTRGFGQISVMPFP